MEIIVKELLNASVSYVWDAITQPNKMKQWYFADMPDFKPELGFKTSFIMNSPSGNKFTAKWQVTEVVKEKIIKCNWSYEEYDGLGIVSFILSPVGDKTLITVTNEGLNTFPQEIPEFTNESCIAGWEYFINKRLPNYLNKNR